ncbi:hypothetical protein [Legionella hackeliae]|uniref:LssZ protein n=1 Tax=Legionella hackeliae TaxID=449 RepID=A0A0A8UUD2_LEGHA|nr:hypothetical protein [Legionella hackeliae]KTD11490.1 type I secretion system LssZ [Legionella hackeliae]CEK10677.1 LssZ protein [Legionella hackeliae]STX47424.1 type I secretion system LssZ [Legionella hackeliae]
MISIADGIHLLLPALALLVFTLGLKFRRNNYVLVALWISLIALILQYHASGGEILGSYFNHMHAAAYSLNIIVLLASIFFFMFTFLIGKINNLLQYGIGLVGAVLVTGSVLLLINLWINANFVENRLPGTPILQVATFNKPSYCGYKYVFYKINANGKVEFMCPNHYGLLPSVGELETAPDFVIKQLPKQLQTKFQQTSREQIDAKP